MTASSGPVPTPRPTTQATRRLAPGVGRSVSALSRAAGRGEGAVIGGKVALRIDPGLARRLAAPMQVALVSGTNGKTTTTTLLAAGMRGALARTGVVDADARVATNKQGANLSSGLTGALLAAPEADHAVLEVDESFLPWALEQLAPRAVALLNLSRDQLDRLHEVRATAERWHEALAAHPPEVVVANADDPLVAWAAQGGSHQVAWVGAGLAWAHDSSACPWCEADLVFEPDGWRCPACGQARPALDYRLDGDDLIDARGTHPLGLALPGRSARANAAMAFATIDRLGLPAEGATGRWGRIASIEGRYQRVHHLGHDLVLHLAKNPGGWADLLDLVADGRGPLVLILNAQGQDGRDPSWIWDVPFERLAGRQAVCFGERGLDLAVRLTYAGVDVTRASDLDDALNRLADLGAPPDPVDQIDPADSDEPRAVPLIANYSAFQQVRRHLATCTAGDRAEARAGARPPGRP